MSLSTIKLFDVSITVNTKNNILEYVKKYIGNRAQGTEKPLIIVTPNPEQVVLARHDKKFAEILNWADISIPDGIGIVWAARILGLHRSLRRIPGVEFIEDLLQIAVQKGESVAFIGAKPGVADKALECLSSQYSGFSGWATDEIDIDVLVKRILQEKTAFVFVGLGAPKQELVIQALSKKVSHCVFMSVGGSFDILSGSIQRAPLFARMMGFEWLYRLVQEPWRWKRQLSLVRFIFLVLRERLHV